MLTEIRKMATLRGNIINNARICEQLGGSYCSGTVLDMGQSTGLWMEEGILVFLVNDVWNSQIIPDEDGITFSLQLED
jgi:hypothetical protein